MGSLTGFTPYSFKFSCSPAINSLESALQLSLSNLEDLVLEFEQMKEVIAGKDKVIQLTASALTKFEETKNFNIITDIFKILRGDTYPPTATETKPSPIFPQAITTIKMEIKKEPESPVYSPEKDSITELNAKEDSLLEIEGTPTGRTSPIIQPKKFRKPNNSTDFREKQKCPDIQCPSETKTIKLLYTITPVKKNPVKNGLRLKQSKLNLVKLKQSNSIDLTRSPEFAGGVRVTKTESLGSVQPLVKKESIETEDTILPSPTSGPTNFTALYKSAAKNSPSKSKTPLSLSRLKTENIPNDKKCESPLIADTSNIEESINLLQPNRKNEFKRQSPVKAPFIDGDITECETQKDDSMSLLQHVKILEGNKENEQRKSPAASPSKKPLMENKNIVNMPEDVHIESSLSLLRPDIKAPTEDKVKRKVSDPAEDIYKEPTVRKKAEKRALPGWSCDECRDFYDELYKDDPEMLAKKMEECSKHRGRHNPVRPPTPGNYWNPRWDVPTNTEEFNKRNNAV